MPEDLQDDYQQAGFAGRLGAGARPALLVVDAQRGYTDPTSPLYASAEHAVSGMAATLELARDRDLPIVYTRVAYRADGHDGGVFRRKVAALDLLVEGRTSSAIVDELAPRDGEVVLTKNYASAFFATPLAAHLTAAGIDTVVVVGFTTSGCVRATAVDACQHGFVPLVVADAVGDRAADPHEANLFDLDAKYADVVTLTELPAVLDAGTAR